MLQVLKLDYKGFFGHGWSYNGELEPRGAVPPLAQPNSMYQFIAINDSQIRLCSLRLSQLPIKYV